MKGIFKSFGVGHIDSRIVVWSLTMRPYWYAVSSQRCQLGSYFVLMNTREDGVATKRYFEIDLQDFTRRRPTKQYGEVA